MGAKNRTLSMLKKINEYSTKDDFNKYWNGFKKYPIALYDQKDVYLINHNSPPTHFIEKDGIFVGRWSDKFFGNTAIELNGEYTAIWDMSMTSPSISCEQLYASLVHECFHCYQGEIKFDRYANEFLYIKYPITAENIVLRVEERKNLLCAAFAKDNESRKHYISKFIACREKRRKIIGDYLDYELGQESNEGIATYIEYLVYSSKVDLPEEYIKSKYGLNLEGYPKNLLTLRASCYSSGLYICLILDSIMDDWKDRFIESNFYLYDFLKEHICVVDGECNIDDLSKAEYLIKQDKQSKEEQLDNFCKSKGYKVVLKGEFRVSGLDPMNIVPFSDIILHKHFLSFKINQENYFIKGQVLSNHCEEFMKIKEITYYEDEEPKENCGYVETNLLGRLRGHLGKENDKYYICLDM